MVYQVIDDILRAVPSWRVYKYRSNKAFRGYEAIIGAFTGMNVSGTPVPFGSVEDRAVASAPRLFGCFEETNQSNLMLLVIASKDEQSMNLSKRE